MNSDDYAKMFDFLESIMADGKELRQQILYSLSELFDYNHLTFFLADDNNLADPVTLNIEERFMKSYLDYYHRTDIFSSHMTRGYRGAKVLTITDAMVFREYENTEFYTDFIRKQGFYHELAVGFHDGRKAIGGMGLLKPKGERMFSSRDIGRVKLIARFIWERLQREMTRQDLHEREMQVKCTVPSPVGTIIFDDRLSIVYSDFTDRGMVRKIFGVRSGHVSDFVKQMITDLGSGWKMGSSRTISAPPLGEYTVHITPLRQQTSDFIHPKWWILSLVPNRSTYAKQVTLRETYDLTKRELEVLLLAKKGLTNEEIAAELFISVHTVKSHLLHIFRKMGVSNRTAACSK